MWVRLPCQPNSSNNAKGWNQHNNKQQGVLCTASCKSRNTRMHAYMTVRMREMRFIFKFAPRLTFARPRRELVHFSCRLVMVKSRLRWKWPCSHLYLLFSGGHEVCTETIILLVQTQLTQRLLLLTQVFRGVSWLKGLWYFEDGIRMCCRTARHGSRKCGRLYPCIRFCLGPAFDLLFLAIVSRFSFTIFNFICRYYFCHLFHQGPYSRGPTRGRTGACGNYWAYLISTFLAFSGWLVGKSYDPKGYRCSTRQLDQWVVHWNARARPSMSEIRALFLRHTQRVTCQ